MSYSRAGEEPSLTVSSGTMAQRTTPRPPCLRRTPLYRFVLSHRGKKPVLTITQAKMHGNEPSKGAKVDAQLQAEEGQRIREKQGK